MTRMMLDMKDNDYEELLKKLSLATLETRRLRGNLIEVFKIMKGFNDVNSRNFFSLSWFTFRCHFLKLYKSRCNVNVRKFNFSNRVF